MDPDQMAFFRSQLMAIKKYFKKRINLGSAGQGLRLGILFKKGATHRFMTNLKWFTRDLFYFGS